MLLCPANNFLSHNHISISEKIAYILPHNWKRVGKLLVFKDKLIVTALIGVIIVSFFWWAWFLYSSLTVIVPKQGGEYTEGIIGQPQYINPLLSQTSQADADLSTLVYSGLFRFDGQGKAVADLADSFEVSEDFQTYIVHLKGGLKWQDGEDLDASDVVFTINILQDQSYKSPLRQRWMGVDVSQSDNRTVVFKLKNPFMGFLDNLTVGILPKHIWETISAEKFTLTELNLHPIGSGPFAFSSLQKDSNGNILSAKLISNKYYAGGQPYISKLTLNFYPDKEALIGGYNKKEIMGMAGIAAGDIGLIKNMRSTNVRELMIPRYFTIFFNQTKNAAIADDAVRKALSLSIDRQAVVDRAIDGRGAALSTPFMPKMREFNAESVETYDVEQAKKLLEEAGWKQDGGSAVRKKGSVELSFELVTADATEISGIPELLKNYWEKIGARVDIKLLPIFDLNQNYIKTRNYEALLYGQEISFNPDLYYFWHSSQKKDGLNLAMLDNKDLDALLEDVRQDQDENSRIEKYKQFQKELLKIENNPAIFLYSPYYLYPANSALNGVETEKVNTPEGRFSGVEKWFVKTSRVWKK